MMTAKALLHECPPSYKLDAEILLAHVLNLDRIQLQLRLAHPVGDEMTARYRALLTQRLAGYPLAYLRGSKEFWSMELDITPSVLVPRPETELLVETVLRDLPNESLKILELGTGSGAIALALASERKCWHVVASDISPQALACAAANVDKYSLSNLTFVLSDWFNAFDEKFDAIISNPPYLAETDPHLLGDGVKFEPKLALVAGKEGTTALQHIITQAALFLFPQGSLFLEHGYDQAAFVDHCLKAHGFRHIQQLKDYGGCDRISLGTIPREV